MINAVTAVTVAALVLASAAAARSSIAPGQRIANYISRHTTRPERRSFQGVELAGGHSQVVNGEVVVEGGPDRRWSMTRIEG